MSGSGFTLLLFILVLARSGYRAYDAYVNRDKTFPISIGLFILVAILAVARYLLRFNDIVVYIGLFAAIIASQLVHRSGKKTRGI
jgi:hypothetical protein